MYENLRKQMAIKNISIEEIAKLLNLHRNTISNKLNGGDFTFAESMRIQEILFPEHDMKWLFAKTQNKIEQVG